MLAASPLLFDSARLIARRSRAAGAEPLEALSARLAEEFSERLGVVTRAFDRILDMASPGEALREAIVARGLPRPIALEPTPTLASARPAPVVVARPDVLPFAAGSLDLIVCSLVLQTIDDLPGTLVQARRALKADGLFLAALLAGDTFSELRQAFAVAESEIEGGLSPRVAPFADARDLGGLLQRAGFALPVVDTDRLTIRYADAFALMRDLRAAGAANPLQDRRKTFTQRATLLRMAEVYAERFADPDGRVRATIEIVWLSGWAPHETQQKPLRPGSAKARLADALNAIEIPAGEKAGG